MNPDTPPRAATPAPGGVAIDTQDSAEDALSQRIVELEAYIAGLQVGGVDLQPSDIGLQLNDSLREGVLGAVLGVDGDATRRGRGSPGRGIWIHGSLVYR